MRRAGALLLTLAACTEAPPPPAPRPTRTPAVATAPPPPASDAPGSLPAPELADVGTARGTWQQREGWTSFHWPDGTALFALACDVPARRVTFRRFAVSGGRLKLVTATAAVSVSAQVDPAARALTGDLAADDAFLTALAAADDRFGVLVDDGKALAMPVGPLVRAVIAECRRPR